MRRYNSSRKFLEDFRQKVESLDRKSKSKVKKIEEKEEEEVKQEPVVNELLKHNVGAIPWTNTVHRGRLYMLRHTFLDVIGNTRWEMNRPLDEEHIQALFLSFEELVENKEGNLSFYEPINIAYVIEGNYIRVIDGQHRMEAIKGIRLKYRDYEFYVPVLVWNVKTELDMMNLLHLINHKKAFDMNLIRYDEAELISEMESKFRVRRFKSIFGKRRPHLDKDKFLEKIEGKFESWRLRYGEIENVIRRIDEMNQFVKNNIRVSWGNSTFVRQRAEEMGFYLALDREMGWVDMIYKN